MELSHSEGGNRCYAHLESWDSGWWSAAIASLPIRRQSSTPMAMGDKNPKAKRKLQTQHELLKKHKTEEMTREQQRLHELHEMKHPHEQKG